MNLKRKVVDDIRKTVIAFANSEGGTIYIGIDDDGTVVGVKDVGDEMLRLSNMIRDAIKPDVTMFVSYTQEKEKGKDIIKVTVQKGTECPYYLHSKGLRPEGVFVRQGASSVPTTKSSIRRMIMETDGDSYEEMRSLNQELTFDAAVQEFKIRSVPFGANHLKTLHLVNKDGIYTNLGLLLSDQCAHSIKAAVFEGKEKAVFKDRREFTGSLLKQLNDAFAYISQYNRVRAEFTGLYRTEKKDYPEEALREALLKGRVDVYTYEGKGTGGIIYWVSGSTIPTKFNDIIIENCTVQNTEWTGITMGYTPWKNRGGENDGAGAWNGHTNVIIRNNYGRYWR